MSVDYVADWVWNVGDIVPPFCVELVLRDGSRYCLHSVSAKNEDTKTLVLRIWDLRALTEADLEELKQNLNKAIDRSELLKEQKIHPKLDWANLRVHLEDIAYCVEWHDRLWPEDDRPKIGFAHE